MSESDEPKSRMRWFQFDLRLFFVLITAIGVILAFEIARRSDATRAKGLKDTMKVGDRVILRTYDYGFEIAVRKGEYSHVINEIGSDFIRLTDLDGTVTLVPLAKIHRVVEYAPQKPRVVGGGGMPGGGGMMPGGGGGMAGGAMVGGGGAPGGAMPGGGKAGGLDVGAMPAGAGPGGGDDSGVPNSGKQKLKRK